MIALDAVVGSVAAHPFAVLFPLAVLEGPIVTVIAAWLMRDSLWDLTLVYAICVLADLVGDAGLYVLGRRTSSLSPRWRRRLGITEDRLARLWRHFSAHGPATLAIGKLTHSAGLAVLMAAGASGMPFGKFMFWNLLATLPKTFFFVVIGYLFGAAYGAVDSWLFRGSLGVAVALGLAALAWMLHRRARGA